MDNFAKDFDSWNEKKKLIHGLSTKDNFYFSKREIWWCSLGLNIGYEQDGKNEDFERPILILKVFNKEVLWILPLTSKFKDNKYYYNFKYKDKDFSIILSQIRLISSKRLLRKIWTFPSDDFKKVNEIMARYFK